MEPNKKFKQTTYCVNSNSGNDRTIANDRHEHPYNASMCELHSPKIRIEKRENQN